MARVKYKVLESFDPNRDYGIHITRQVSQCLQYLEQGQEFEPKEITLKCQNDTTLMRNPNFIRAKCIVSEAMTIGSRIGVLDSVALVPMTFSEFCQLESVQYFKDQLRGFKQNHMESTNQGTLGGTQKLYLNRVWSFSNWLSGREFVITRLHQVDLDVFKKSKEKVILQHAEHLLHLYQESEEERESESEIEIEVELEDGTAKIEAEFGDEYLEFETEWVDEQTTIDEIALKTGLSIEEIEDAVVFDFDESEGEEEDNERDDEDLEIEVEVKNNRAKIKIELDDDDYRFVLSDDVSESAIISAIIDKTGLTEDEITSNWDFEIEDDEREEENDGLEESTPKSDKLEKKKMKAAEKLAKRELKATEKAEETILKLEQKIDQLEQRLQKLLEKVETGEYFGKISESDPVPNYYSISFNGLAVSFGDDTITDDVEGEIFLESLMTKSKFSKLRITGGEILVGDKFYDIVFGKARLSSSGPSGEKGSMTVLGQVIDEQGNVNTIRLTLDGTINLDDFSESIDFEINPLRSKIASQWNLGGTGQLSLL